MCSPLQACNPGVNTCDKELNSHLRRLVLSELYVAKPLLVAGVLPAVLGHPCHGAVPAHRGLRGQGAAARLPLEVAPQVLVLDPVVETPVPGGVRGRRPGH